MKQSTDTKPAETAPPPTAEAPLKSSQPTRYHALDALRAFALLLGVVYHAAESFMAGHESWAIVDRSPSLTLDLFRHGCHAFRLELFFVMAGFFARLLYHRRGGSGFWRNRLSRILVPLVIGWVLLYPLLVFLWISGAAKSGQWSFLGIPPEAQDLAPWQLTIGFFLRGMFIEKFDLTHLWFLHQLLVIYGLVLGLRWGVFRMGKGAGPWAALWDRRFRAVWVSRGVVFWWLIPTVPILLLMGNWGVDTPKSSLIPELAPTLLYGLFFLVGWGLHRNPELLEEPARRWPQFLLTGMALILPTRFAGDYFLKLGLFGTYYVEARWMHSVLYAVMMWSFVLGWMGLFVRFFPAASRLWRYVADSSYWIYLIHLPLVVWLQIGVALWPVPWAVKFGLINLAAFPLLFVSYHFLVRSTFIGRQLNGRRHPRR